MRLEEFDGSDPLTGDAGFVRDGTDDIADAHLIALADGQEDALLAGPAGRAALHHREATGRTHLADRGDGACGGGCGGGAYGDDFQQGAFIQPQRCGRDFNGVVIVEQRREERQFAGRRATAVLQGVDERGPQSLDSRRGLRLPDRRHPRGGRARCEATEGRQFFGGEQGDRVDRARGQGFGQRFGRHRRVPQDHQRHMLRGGLTDDLHQHAVNGEADARQGTGGAGRGLVAVRDDHDGRRINGVEQHAQGFGATGDGRDDKRRRHGEGLVADRRRRHATGAMELRFEERLGGRRFHVERGRT